MMISESFSMDQDKLCFDEWREKLMSCSEVGRGGGMILGCFKNVGHELELKSNRYRSSRLRHSGVANFIIRAFYQAFVGWTFRIGDYEFITIDGVTYILWITFTSSHSALQTKCLMWSIPPLDGST